jgi:PAS domain S-box-containing protein
MKSSAVKAPLPEERNSPAKESRPRVLLVDDDERNLLALSEILDPIATIVTANNGKTALRELLKGDFAVILLDVFMPEMDGYETAALIRQRSAAARIPIIFLSAVNQETEHLMRGYSMGAVDYVFKPVDPVVLKSKVAVFVDLFELRQQVASQAAAEQNLREAALRAEHEALLYERELQQARLRQAAILEALPIILYLEGLEADPRVPHLAGGNFAAVTGFRFEDVQANPHLWQERLHPQDRERALKAIAGRRRSGTMAVEYRWQCADGRYKHFLDQAVLLRDPAGKPVEYAGTLLDISEQRELEQQLIQARKSEALGQLTGGVAHDFNNLLAVVLGGLSLLEARARLGEREKKIVDQMRHAAESGAELVRRLMAFARKQELSPTAIAPAKLRDSVAGLIAHALGDNVTVEWDVPEAGLWIYADEGQLELSLVNLLINARDAMPEGGRIMVTVDRLDARETPRLLDRSREYLRISVRDEGSGIPPELIERVTEPFFTTKAAGEGTGLGLPMVSGFIQQSGGAFRITSETGNGTQIELVIPAAESNFELIDGAAQGGAEPTLVSSVLVVDDDSKVRTILSEQLRDLGLEVTVAEDSEEALSVLEARTAEPPFVLTDFSMPGMDGLSLLNEVGKRWPHVRGAIMTGNPQERIRNGKPHVPVIHKPVDFRELKRLLASA